MTDDYSRLEQHARSFARFGLKRAGAKEAFDSIGAKPKDTPTNSRAANVGRSFTGEVDQCIAERS